MQINGNSGPTMAASEPPEPPPRNPDKINASLKQITETKSTSGKLLDPVDRQVNNNKLYKPKQHENNSISATFSTTTTTSSSTIATTISSPTSATTTATTTITASSAASVEETTMPTSKPIENNDMESVNSIKLNDNVVNKTTSSPSSASSSSSSSTSSSSSSSSSAAVAGATGSATSPNGSNLISKIDTTSPTKCNISDSNTSNQQQTTKVNKNNDNGYEAELYNNRQLQLKDNLNEDLMIDKNSKENNDPFKLMDKPELDDFDDLDSPQSSKLKLENKRLSAEISRLKKLLEISPDGAIGGIDLSDNNSFDTHSTDGSNGRVERLEAELKAAKEQISNLKMERKRLRADKSDLLAHVKQLCASLQDKEQELRDFIRNFEQRIRDTESSAVKMTNERERERWSLLKHARDEAERSLALAAQLNARDIQLQRTQEQLQEARRQLSGCMSDQESLISMAPLTPPSGLMGHLGGGTGFVGVGGTPGDRGSCSADSGVRGSSDKESAAGDLNLSDGPCENGICLTVDPDSISLVSSQHMYQYGTPKERSPTLSPLNSAAFSRSVDNGAISSRSVEQLGSSLDNDGSFISRRLQNKNTNTLGRTSRGSTWGSISKVFARSRHRSRNTQPETEVTDYQWSPLTEEGYAEKLRLLREASSMPIERWRASQVLAWLEVALGMPQYSTRCSENVKSGKVLLELSDAELETGLGLTHPMHRKKLRLAIEEQRRPDLIRYPTIGQLGHTWVASEWLPDIGLPQYAESFLHSFVDARMLDTLSKKELEKMLGVTRKFHQASIVHGIHVLRIIKYDRQELAMRRLQSENIDADPIVWTNQRFIRWARSIDLGEYADNLKDSGVHGGLVILEPSFSGDTMATALGIPPSKNIIRRHLAAEFDALVLPARATLGQGIRSGGHVIPITGPGGLQQQTNDRKNTGSLRFATWRGSQGSLSKVFGFNKSRPEKFGNSTSPTPSYSSSEGGIYATIGTFFVPPPPPTTTPPPCPPSHRVSAPPMDSSSTLPRNGQHRRVKSISDIEIMAATPV